LYLIVLFFFSLCFLFFFPFHLSFLGVSLGLPGLTTWEAPIPSGDFISEVYLAGDSNQPLTRGDRSLLDRALNPIRSGASFCFCGVPLRRALIFLGLLRITPDRSRL
jgi:hypothetical protein